MGRGRNRNRFNTQVPTPSLGGFQLEGLMVSLCLVTKLPSRKRPAIAFIPLVLRDAVLSRSGNTFERPAPTFGNKYNIIWHI